MECREDAFNTATEARIRYTKPPSLVVLLRFFHLGVSPSSQGPVADGGPLRNVLKAHNLTAARPRAATRSAPAELEVGAAETGVGLGVEGVHAYRQRGRVRTGCGCPELPCTRAHALALIS
eukprot:579735-Prorocentrum_minimum.AAC.1